MYKISLLLLLVMTLIPISQANAQSDLLSGLGATPSQSMVIITYTSTSASYEISQCRKMLEWMIFRYETVHFETDSQRLDPTAEQILKRKAKWIKNENSDKQIVVTGHCDQRGSQAYNKKLGTRRAISVKQFLVNCGVERNQIRTDSAGETQPLSPENNEIAWAKNRRAEVKLHRNPNTTKAF